MQKTRLLGVATMAALFAGSAMAAQNVANTNQKGSLLVWPLITVDRTDGKAESTLIEISNDANATIHVECVYVNERKGRVDFDFDLTAKQTASWDVYTRDGDQVNPPNFPTNEGIPRYPFGSVYKGELICWATNPGREYQIAWNHLTGTATVLGKYAPDTAFKYNAWAFAARSDTGLADTNAAVSHGTPGIIKLTGGGAGTYDACPGYNIANFMPNGAELGGIKTISNELAVVSCYQDLRETYKVRKTKLDFTVWNSHEHSFTGAHYCVDSVTSVYLSDPPVTAGSNFDYDVLRTPNARFEVRGVKASPPCPRGTQIAGLLGVLVSKVVVGGVVAAEVVSPSAIGDTTHHAGILPGFVFWDVAPPVGARTR